MSFPNEFLDKRRAGFGEKLYRDLRHKKIAGVCAGLAEHFEIDRNIMRVVFLAFFLFTNVVAIWVYLGLWVLLAPKPIDYPSSVEYDETERCYRKKKLFRYKKSVSERLLLVRERIAGIEHRLSDMERYVTSNKFKLNQQFSKL